MENAFDCLCSIVRLDEFKPVFMDAEGMELMVIMIRYGAQHRLCSNVPGRRDTLEAAP